MVAFAARIVAIRVFGNKVDQAQAVAQLCLKRPHPVAHAGVEARVEAAHGDGGVQGVGVVGIVDRTWTANVRDCFSPGFKVTSGQDSTLLV